MAVASGGSCRRIAVIGDLHTSWDDVDVEYFNHSDYDLLLFTGDLGDGTVKSGLRIARSVARLGRPTLVMPGNNDSTHTAQLAAEFAHQRGLSTILSIGQRSRSRALAAALGDVGMCGYSLHGFATPDRQITIIAGRPHGMGGPDLAFAPYLERAFGVGSLEASRDRLIELVDRAETDDLLFLSHNGPKGLGAAPTDIWGRDFHPAAGDWGDPDLTAAIAHSKRVGKRVLAVVAGHMHLATKGGAERTWLVERDGTAYVNAARVPRIFPKDDNVMRHHVALTIRASGVDVEEVLVPQY